MAAESRRIIHLVGTKATLDAGSRQGLLAYESDNGLTVRYQWGPLLANTAYLARRDAAQTFAGTQTFSGTVNAQVGLQVAGTLRISSGGAGTLTSLTVSGGAGFFGATAVGARPVVTGSRKGSAALQSTLSALSSFGLVTDSTTAGLDTVINVRDYGAVGDGVTDDSAAIQAACEAARSFVANDPSGGDRISKRTIYFPAGVYLITQSECILPSTFTLKGRGYRLIGDGPGQTTIWFKPTTGSRILIHNNNAFLSSDVRDMTFRSDSNLNTFYKSLSEQPAGAVQRWSFERVEWSGAWGKGFELYGNNNNSEYRWEDCGVGGEMGIFLYTPPSISSDQHLNFWFDCMKFWPTVGAPSTNCFCELNLGGSVVIDKSDFSGLQSGTLFKLKGSSHAQGVCHFACNNTRFELKSDNVKVLECDWPQGVVSFNKCDFSSQRSTYSQDTEAFTFNDVNVAGASAIFDGCSLIGCFRFISSSDDFRHKKHASFIGCNFEQVDVFDAIKYTSPVNSGGRRPVEFRNCRGSGTGLNTQTSWAASTAYTVGTQRRSGSDLFEVVTAGTSGSTAPTGKGSSIADGSVVWKWVRAEPSCYANDAIVNGFSSWNPAGLARRAVSFKDANAGLPFAGGALNIILPPNALIVRVLIFSPSGAVTSGAIADYQIFTEEDSPSVFCAVSTTPASAGFSSEWVGLFQTGADIKRRSLLLRAGAPVDQPNFTGVAIVEYLA